MNTLADWIGLLPGEKTLVDGTEVEVAGLVIGPAGFYMLLTVDTPLPEGWSFQVNWKQRPMAGTVDYCEHKDGKYLVGIEIQRVPEAARMLC